jgi:hypothetical protein
MLRVVDLASGASLSCSLMRDSTVSQVVVALKRRRSTQFVDDLPTCALYGIWNDEKQRIHAKKLRGDDRPLLLVEHLKRTTGQAPKLSFTAEIVSTRLMIATLAPDEETNAFARRGISLQASNEAEFVSTIQRLGSGDICGFLLTNATDAVTKHTESGMKWWVLNGEKLWFQSSLEDDARTPVHLADNKVLGPWAAEFELQTTLNVYRLIAANPKDARAWVDCLSVRIALATENELISCADVLVSEEEKAFWRRADTVLGDLDKLNGWCYSPATVAQLCRFARTDGSEYLLLFYLDSESSLQTGNLNLGVITRRFQALSTLPASLQAWKDELVDVDNGPMNPSLGFVRQLLSAVKTELEEGLLVRFRSKKDVYDRLVSELPLLLEQEQAT